MKQELATVKIFRFDPSIDKTSKYDVYHVPFRNISILGVLHYIREQYDGTLAFHSGCEGRQSCKCGGCVVLVNGMPTLCCSTPAEKNMTIEPHPKYEIIKDLAIDPHRVKKDRREIVKWKTNIRVDNELCNGCGDCVIICPVQVYKIKAGKSYPADESSCCGIECYQCTDYCPQSAITVTPKQ